MDCEKLHQDITKLKSLRNDIVSQLASAKEEGVGKIQLNKSIKKSSELSDQILESYLQDFIEHNPEISGWELSDRIEVEEKYLPSFVGAYNLRDGSVMVTRFLDGIYSFNIDENGVVVFNQKIEIPVTSAEGCIQSIAPLPNGDALAIDKKRIIYIPKEENGTFEIIESDMSFLKDPGYVFKAVATVSEDDILIGGENGLLLSARLSSAPNGRLLFQENDIIKGFQDKKDKETDVDIITKLPDGSVLIGGNRGALYNATQQPDGSWSLGDRINIFDNESFFGSTMGFLDMSVAPDGSVWISGYGNELFHIRKTPDNSWEQIEKIRLPSFGFWYSVSASDNSIVIGGEKSAYSMEKDSKGEWKFSNIITESIKPDDSNPEPPEIKFTTPLPNGTILIGGWGGMLHQATYEPPSLDSLKKHLGEISKKAKMAETSDQAEQFVPPML